MSWKISPIELLFAWTTYDANIFKITIEVNIEFKDIYRVSKKTKISVSFTLFFNLEFYFWNLFPKTVWLTCRSTLKGCCFMNTLCCSFIHYVCIKQIFCLVFFLSISICSSFSMGPPLVSIHAFLNFCWLRILIFFLILLPTLASCWASFVIWVPAANIYSIAPFSVNTGL